MRVFGYPILRFNKTHILRQHLHSPFGDFAKQMAALSTNSIHTIVEGADHASFWLDAETAKVSVAAILQVVEAARTGQPLAQE